MSLTIIMMTVCGPNCLWTKLSHEATCLKVLTHQVHQSIFAIHTKSNDGVRLKFTQPLSCEV